MYRWPQGHCDITAGWGYRCNSFVLTHQWWDAKPAWNFQCVELLFKREHCQMFVWFMTPEVSLWTSKYRPPCLLPIRSFMCASVVLTSKPLEQQTSNESRFFFCWLGGEDGPRERPREWQLALANRTTANGTPHLLLLFSCPPPIPVPTSVLLENVLSSPAAWHPSAHYTVYTNIHNPLNIWHCNF